MNLHYLKLQTKIFLFSEVVKYIFFGILATIVYFATRTTTFAMFDSAVLSSIIASILSILFAFFTNDFFVFVQPSNGRIKRLMKFFIARIFTLFLDMFLAWLLVDKYPNVIGNFVQDNMHSINLVESFISQVAIIILNYIISKFFVFK